MPFFSIIIPLFNKENFIQNTLTSVLNQSYNDFEIIIVNDGSTDKSEEKVLAFKDSRIRYFTKENGGVSTARNYGIQKATSAYIAFLDADDYWYPQFLEKMFHCITTHKEYQIFASAIEIETKKKTFSAQYSIPKTGKQEVVNYFSASLKYSAICTSAAVFHVSVLDRVGDFDPRIKSGQDTDMWIRMGLLFPIVFSWEILARYVYDIQSLSRNKNLNSEKMIFDKFIEEEKKHAALKTFLDLNRFSLAIKCKLVNEKTLYKTYYNAIDIKKLSLKKRILLHLPAFVLQQLLILHSFLTAHGLGNSVFK